MSLTSSQSMKNLELIASLFNDSVSKEELSQLSFSEQELRLLDRMMNNTGDQAHPDDYEFDFLHRPAWRGLILTLYVSVIVIGLVGNVVVVFIVAKNKHMQNVTNIFIANLALSDIGLCMFSLPVQLYYQVTNNWMFGQVMCKIVFGAFAVPMCVSTITIFLIACDRYRLIVYPLKDRMKLKTALLFILTSVLISIILAIPVMCFAKVEHVHFPDIRVDRKYCMERWPATWPRIVYSISTFLFQFCLPLIITALLYYKIYCRLKRRPSQRASNADRTGKTNKILFAIVVLFIICWLPWNLLSLIAEIDINIVKGPHFKLVDLLLKMFAMSSACINPFLYCWLNDNFRKELDSMAIKLRILRQPSYQRQAQVHYHATPTAGENGHTTMIHDNNMLGATTITTDKVSHYSNFNSVHTNTNLLAVH